MTDHHTHHDPAVRELIAQAEQRGAERVAQAVERLADEWWGRATEATQPPSWRGVTRGLRALLAEHRDEHPAPEPPSDVTEHEVARLLTEHWFHDGGDTCECGYWAALDSVKRHHIEDAILAAFHVTPRVER